MFSSSAHPRQLLLTNTTHYYYVLLQQHSLHCTGRMWRHYAPQHCTDFNVRSSAQPWQRVRVEKGV